MRTLRAWRRQLWQTARGRDKTAARGSDRLEAVVVLAAVLVAFAALPFTAALGSEVYASQSARSDWESRTRHPATATLLTDGQPEDGQADGVVADRHPTEAVWLMPNGAERTGKVPAEEGTKAGERVPIWLDGDGNPVAPPLSRAGAAINAVSASLGVWVAVCLLLFGACALLHLLLDRYRYDQWDRAWRREQQRWTRS
ncbi:hypothetical protein [Amycolatopsis suaedae]|uniref:Transmembrane protein n=1 Tax=Amycolatopsis suaedae TaxID=2510978 RepID=A0A4Q7JDG7_9PSEU|nr:hypothetical protein [Amycolatopsis suaedae]RZQ65931.1 hypothetical protein EWH70_02330 [Amycolatopsis suaedae]